MKKVLFFALSLLVAATAFISCGPDPVDNPTTDITLTLSTTELVLAPGDEQRLQCTISPAGTSVTLSWASSNTSVATVSQSGIVTAVADGEAVITVSYNDVKAECKVSVTSAAVYENFQLAGYGLFGSEFVPVPGTDTIIELNIGEVNAQLATINLLAWDGNVLYEEGWVGAGLVMEAEVAVFLIAAGEKTSAASAAYGQDITGFYIGSGVWEVSDLKAQGVNYAPYAMQSGSINVNNYGTIWSYMMDTTYCSLAEAQAAYQNFVEGAYVYYVDATGAEPEFREEYAYAVVNQLVMGEDENEEFLYRAQLTWSDLYAADRFFGLKANFDEEGYVVSLVKPFDYATVGPREYANFEPAAVPAKKAIKLGDMNRVHNEVPEFVMKARSARKDQMYRK